MGEVSGAERRPIGFLNYRRDVTVAIGRMVDTGQPMGPNYMGELMWPVTAEYDAETNMTRVGFSLIPAQVTP